MNTIEGRSANDINAFAEETLEALRAAISFEAAAQLFAERLVAHFTSIALARVFGTVEFQQLPSRERDFATTVASEVSLFPKTEVLTLFGTAGIEPQWCDRRRSHGHLAIPLLSRYSIDAAPMISKLLNDLHYTIVTDPTSSQVRPAARAFANANALCYIADAGSSVDLLGRPVVPAADFVQKYGIKTVIGVGGSYVVARRFVAIVLFTTETISRETAQQLIELSSAFKAATTAVIRQNALFG